MVQLCIAMTVLPRPGLMVMVRFVTPKGCLLYLTETQDRPSCFAMVWENTQSQQTRLVEQDWSNPLLQEANILGKGFHALCSCSPAHVNLQLWADSFALLALLPFQRPYSPGLEMSEGCWQSGVAGLAKQGELTLVLNINNSVVSRIYTCCCGICGIALGGIPHSLWYSSWPFWEDYSQKSTGTNSQSATPQVKPETRSPPLSPHLSLGARERSFCFPCMKDSRFYSHSHRKESLRPQKDELYLQTHRGFSHFTSP